MKLLIIDPAILRLPPSRRSGPDPRKLAVQIQSFGDSSVGMRPVQVTQCAAGQLMINDGVTRACRLAKLSPGATIEVEVIEDRPGWTIEHLPLVKDVL